MIDGSALPLSMPGDLEIVLDYHERTKHRFERYAAGPGRLDWATQPDPFRTFAGAPHCALPLLDDTQPDTRYVDLYVPGAIPPQPPTLATLAAILELAFGLSAWKQYGNSRWALRCNPSSGNLHPTEAYVVTQGIAGLADGVHHYISRDHLLEQHAELGAATRLVPPESFVLGLTSIHWREAWKYGERAYRYCQHDLGHAIAAARFAAAALGWHAALIDDAGDADIAAVLGLDRAGDFAAAEREHPDALLLVSRQPQAPQIDIAALVAALTGWRGEANRASPHHAHEWPIIDTVARACTKPPTHGASWCSPAPATPLPSPCNRQAAALIRQRRSAQAFDGTTGIDSRAFYRMLDMTLPRPGLPPWDAIPWPPRIHLALFVHRVEGLPPGLYALPRLAEREATLRGALSPGFAWEPAERAPSHLPLYRLLAADTRAAAKALACHQDIAADGAFSLAMLAEFEPAVRGAPWRYRHLFWEAGLLGQVLYLEAEAAGVRGTGIGCFFDDPVHEALGLRGRDFQSLYHFTVGSPLTDPRLETLPPYAHLRTRSTNP